MTRSADDVPHTLVNSHDQLPHLADALTQASRLAIDTEVPISGPGAGQLRVMSIATRSPTGHEQAFVVDARDLDPTTLAPLLTDLTADADAWNANFDARVVDAAVWSTTDTTPHLTWWDAQLADALLHQGRSGFTWYHGLAWAVTHYLGLEIDGKGTTQLSYTAHDDLTPDQITYAAADAVLTLWVGDAIRAEITAADLDPICHLEQAARPFLDQMERTGLAFDWDGWQAELTRIEHQHRTTIGHLASLTGGGQGTLFDQVVEPNWNPASDKQVRAALNQWAEPAVRDWTRRRHGTARLLTDTDSVRAEVLREIGGELCHTLLEFRDGAKILTTYGDSIGEHLHPDGRLRPQYLQVVGTNTGRLASRNPNAQNFTPRMKPFLRPDPPPRVFVHADLSQAELRYLAQVADDAPLRQAFARGDDVHVTTAATMFGFDPDHLRRHDPDRFKHLRSIAKALNFGIAYGTGATALGRSLSAEGTPTTTDEAANLLAQYRRTYPGTAAWAEDRIAEIRSISGDTTTIDWPLTLRLARGFRRLDATRRDFRRSQGRWPSIDELIERHPDRMATATTTDDTALRAEIEWLLPYHAPVALTAGGTPFRFASRTRAGRRQQFELHLDRLFLGVVIETITANDPGSAQVRHRFEHDHNLDLGRHEPLTPAQIEARFEERDLRRAFIDTMAAELGHPLTHAALARSAKERTQAMVNAWRNAPIQGGVADIMLAAYADLHHRLRPIPGAWPVQTVHDSVVIECDRADAPRVAAEVTQALEAASVRFCPDVTPKADVDIRTSLAEADIVADDDDPTSRAEARPQPAGEPR